MFLPISSRRRRVFIETCCGGANVALSLLAARAPALVTYLGGKRRWAPPILSTLGLAPGAGADVVVLNDAGPWGWVWPSLVDRHRRAAVLSWLRSQPDDGEALWRRLAHEAVPADPDERAATWLCLQAGSVLGKPVHVLDGAWRTVGFASLSPAAVSRGFRHRFQAPRLAQRADDIGAILDTTTVLVENVTLGALPVLRGPQVTVYVDPPYKRRTGYGIAPSEGEVEAVVARFLASGAVVGVSEGRPYDEVLGGQAFRLVGSLDARSSKSAVEYVTVYAPTDVARVHARMSA